MEYAFLVALAQGNYPLSQRIKYFPDNVSVLNALRAHAVEVIKQPAQIARIALATSETALPRYLPKVKVVINVDVR